MAAKPHTLIVALAVCLSLGSTASAQVAPKPAIVPAVNPNGEEVVQLTPFQVNAGDNTGWAPTETLAGTRFKTKLSDVASQIDVFTLDFMEDFGFTSIDAASVYSLNIENSTEFVSNVESKGAAKAPCGFAGLVRPGGPGSFCDRDAVGQLQLGARDPGFRSEPDDVRDWSADRSH